MTLSQIGALQCVEQDAIIRVPSFPSKWILYTLLEGFYNHHVGALSIRKKVAVVES